VLVPLFEIAPAARRLDVVLVSWLTMSAVTLACGVAWVVKTWGWTGYGPFDARWLARGIKIAGLYFASTLLFRGISTFDRFVIESVAGAETVAKYALAMTIGMVVPNIADPAVLAYSYPKQIHAFQTRDATRFRTVTVESARSTLLAVAVLGACALVSGTQVARIIGDSAYDLPISWLVIAVLAGALFALALLPHYVLYAAGKDIAILGANVASFVVFVGGVAVARMFSSVSMVLVAVTVSYAVLLTAKSVCAAYVWRDVVHSSAPNVGKTVKTAIAILYTPLHVASLVRTLPHLDTYDKIFVVHWGASRGTLKYGHYREVLRQSLGAKGRIVEPERSALCLLWARAFVYGLFGIRCFDAVITGNPRRTPSLLAARAAERIVVVDEGSGTTKPGGYFDMTVRETNRAKILLQCFGVVPAYESVFRRVASHYTVYKRSIFPGPVFLAYSSASPYPVPATAGKAQVLVVSSGIRFRGIPRYVAMMSAALAEARPDAEVLFCPHPADAAAEISAVVNDVPGAKVLNTPLLLEEYCEKVIAGGGVVTLRGDPNSTSMLLDEVMPVGGRYFNETDRVA
jgi:hypothetical protein